MQWPPVGIEAIGWEGRALVMSAVLAASYYSANVAVVAKDPKVGLCVCQCYAWLITRSKGLSTLLLYTLVRFLFRELESLASVWAHCSLLIDSVFEAPCSKWVKSCWEGKPGMAVSRISCWTEGCHQAIGGGGPNLHGPFGPRRPRIFWCGPALRSLVHNSAGQIWGDVRPVVCRRKEKVVGKCEYGACWLPPELLSIWK
eukprot:scaffold243141_cov16-Tisochrysis_lutea.AAC.1